MRQVLYVSTVNYPKIRGVSLLTPAERLRLKTNRHAIVSEQLQRSAPTGEHCDHVRDEV
jgi:hypothetical protein